MNNCISKFFVEENAFLKLFIIVCLQTEIFSSDLFLTKKSNENACLDKNL